MATLSPHVVVVGSSNTDMIVQVERIPAPGETVLGGKFSMAAGGKGANQAVAAARAGARVSLVAALGGDALSDQALGRFRAEGINTEHVCRLEGEGSGVALIMVGQDGQNCIAVASGANHRLEVSHIHAAYETIKRANCLLVQLETPLPVVTEAIRTACMACVPVILNPAPAQTLPDDLLSQVKFLTPNQSEAEFLTEMPVGDEHDAAKAAALLRQAGVETVIITLGGRGAYVASDEQEEMVPGFSVQPVDTTGAGDVFNGALAMALGEGRPILDAVYFANAAAAISVTRLGAQPSAPTRAEIDALLASQPASC